MRIVFIGTVDFSKHCLKEVLHHGGNVVAVLTPRPERSRFNSDYADLEPVAAARGIPTYRISKINDPETITLIRSLKPDVIFVFGFSQLISKEILDLPPLGCIGTHPALLPSNRGRHPLIWALVKGLAESGLTFFYIDEGTDSGDILWQRSFPITLQDDSGTLYEKVKQLASEAIAEFLPQLESGNAPRTQQDHSQASYLRKRTESDGEINWSWPTMEIHNLIRALTHPYVGAHTFSDSHRVIVWRSRLVPEPVLESNKSASPGDIVAVTGDGVSVRTGDGIIELLEFSNSSEVVLAPGDRLGTFIE
jgi:methionyl-tRNA formyltransferase